MSAPLTATLGLLGELLTKDKIMKLFFNEDGKLHLVASNRHEDLPGFTIFTVPDDLDISKPHTFEDGVTIPIDIELPDLQARLDAYFSSGNYAKARAAEYPSIGDQLDALWKGGDVAAEMLAKVQAVKAKYPKPTE
jgi:hypothetical protein